VKTDYYEYVRKNLENEDLSFEEALRLFDLPLPVVGRIADEIRKRKCGDLVTFVVDRNINYTNYCISRCKFCAFYAKSKEESYVLSKEEILNKIKEAVEVGATQILMQGGINPDLGIEWFEDVFSEIKRRFPNIQLHSLSPPEIDYLARREGMSVREVLERLRDAGLDSLPGGGAEILNCSHPDQDIQIFLGYFRVRLTDKLVIIAHANFPVSCCAEMDAGAFAAGVIRGYQVIRIDKTCEWDKVGNIPVYAIDDKFDVIKG
jgi:2-iminoacetate synthase ThiH